MADDFLDDPDVALAYAVSRGEVVTEGPLPEPWEVEMMALFHAAPNNDAKYEVLLDYLGEASAGWMFSGLMGLPGDAILEA